MGRPRAAAWVAGAFALSAAGSRRCTTSAVVVLEEGSSVGCVRRSYFDEHAEPPVTLRFSGTDVESAVDEATRQGREGTSVFERQGRQRLAHAVATRVRTARRAIARRPRAASAGRRFWC